MELEYINCPVCSADNYEVFLDGAVDRMHGLDGVFKYVRCHNCEHIFLNPRLNLSVLKNYYPDNYGPHSVSALAQKQKRSSKWSSYLSPEERMAKFLSKYITGNSRVLDIGCGRGDFLAKLRAKTGCQCYGVDFSANAVRVAKELYNLDVFCGEFKDAPFADNFFDLIMMWWYLEHDPHPIETLEKCKKVLKKNGWLVFGVPNIKSFNAKVFRNKWFHLDAPRHLSIFSPRSIKVLMGRAGFSVEHLEWDRSTWGLVGSLEYAVWGRAHNLPFRIFKGLWFRALSLPITLLLSFIKLSDIVTVYSRSK